MIRKMMTFIKEHSVVPDRICAVGLALVPILQHYIGLIDNAGTTVLIILAPYLFIRVLSRLNSIKSSHFKLIIILSLFFVYKVIDHGTSFIEVSQAILVIGYLVAVALGCIDLNFFTKAAGCIAAVAGICLIVQYFCFYILGFHLQLVPVSLLLEESEPWVLGAQTGLVGVTGSLNSVYRPSAFFLEPSHLFMYSFPVLFINLFVCKGTKLNKIVAISVTAGMILCTSGMGIITAISAWVLFLVLWNEKDHSLKLVNIIRKRNLLTLGSMFAVLVLAVIFIPFFRESIIRIFYNPGGSNAISGRTHMAIRELKQMNVLQWIFGVSDSTALLGFNMPGFMATLYKYGIVGIMLSYEFYVKGLFKLEISYFCVTVVILVASFFSAHTHGTFFMLYYVFILMEGYNASLGEWQCEVSKVFGAPVRAVSRKLRHAGKGDNVGRH